MDKYEDAEKLAVEYLRSIGHHDEHNLCDAHETGELAVAYEWLIYKRAKEVCEWKKLARPTWDVDSWVTTCGWIIEECLGKFCPYCGRRIAEVEKEGK